MLYGSLLIAQPIVNTHFGLFLSIAPPTLRDLAVLGLVIGAGALTGAIPAFQAYRRSLSDGMMLRT